MKGTTPARNTPALRKNRASSSSFARLLGTYSVVILLLLGAVWGLYIIYIPFPEGTSRFPDDFASAGRITRLDSAITKSNSNSNSPLPKPKAPFSPAKSFLKPFQEVLTRAKEKKSHCNKVITEKFEEPDEDVIEIANMSTARLHNFGVIDALEKWRADPKPAKNITMGASNTNCVIPPENECGESQFTVVFMAYNPDRLTALLKQMQKMLKTDPFTFSIAELIVVWNGPREINESKEGKALLEFAKEESKRCRIVYPLKQGLPNDLMNRYHPDIVQVKTKGILYYDDDGPFYSYEAVLGGFELWKRNANAQIGAMARVIDLDPRQAEEKKGILKGELNDREFISHCGPDDVEYNFRFFANFDANMVLPSGSFLHSNYLCFLWHPVFEPIREYVRAHPVHPDDITVSMMVSQLAGRAPKVYSRRINMDEKAKQLKIAKDTEKQRRRLLFNIDWDKNHNMDEAKEMWAGLRSGAVNSLVRYFGSMNSGSLGWCYGTEFHAKNKRGENVCEPEMARFGKLPWLNDDHTAKKQCP